MVLEGALLLTLGKSAESLILSFRTCKIGTLLSVLPNSSGVGILHEKNSFMRTQSLMGKITLNLLG